MGVVICYIYLGIVSETFTEFSCYFLIKPCLEKYEQVFLCDLKLHD